LEELLNDEWYYFTSKIHLIFSHNL
jgi:hypothetical protein